MSTQVGVAYEAQQLCGEEHHKGDHHTRSHHEDEAGQAQEQPVRKPDGRTRHCNSSAAQHSTACAWSASTAELMFDLLRFAAAAV